ncbi:unnamed protein product [Bemisia tabaci]|uniref:Ionotropic receptor n=1 Tax=Bemisia tabaci TaxID=7038 RepID=A0A9P0F4V5_BEMTA|nr:unnamed protein product [Bemisia tabaci]
MLQQDSVRKFSCMESVSITICVLLLTQRALSVVIQDDSQYSFKSMVATCNHTVRVNHRRLFYIANTVPEFPMPRLVQALHNQDIQTTVIASPRQLKNFVRTPCPNNIIILVNSLNDILNLILDTASDAHGKENGGEKTLMQTHSANASSVLTNYCIRTDVLPHRDINEICDIQLNISSAELEDNGKLTDAVHDLTKGLYVHDVWNSRNHLIFVICSANERRGYYGELALNAIASPEERTLDLNEDPVTSSKLMFVFRFIWRMFSGYKSVVCKEDTCFKYDPFIEKIIRLSEKNKDDFFQFSIKNMQQKKAMVSMSWREDFSSGIEPILINAMNTLMGDIMADISQHLNFSCDYIYVDDSLKFNITLTDLAVEQSHRNGAKLHLLNHATVSRAADLVKFDQTTSLETYAVSVITPRSSFIPQSAVAFKCYSLAVWIFIFITIILFLMMQAFLQHVFYRTLQYIRGGEDVNQDEVSVFLTIYAYFICGQPPRLILGHLYTSRIVFVIVIFASMILSGLFQNGMVTLLSARVRFQDIDTLEELAQSDLRIQVQGIESFVLFFEEQPLPQGMSDILTDTMSAQVRDLNLYFAESGDPQFYTYYWNNSLPLNIPATGMNIYDGLVQFDGAFRRSLQSDAFLVHAPLTLLPRTLLFEHWLIRNFTVVYHKVEENVMTYPYGYKLSKYSFLFDMLNERITSIVEFGLLGKYLPKEYFRKLNGLSVGPGEEGAAPRVFDMNDLQIAFIFLAVGLTLSYFVFVAELCIHP